MGKGLRLGLLAFAILAFSYGYALSAVTYKVRDGDTLQGIAKKHQVSVGKLRSVNGLASSKLRPGQQLVVSWDAASSVKQKVKTKGPRNKNQRTIATARNEIGNEFVRYRVEKGDTLESLADKFDLEKDEILNLNNLKKKRLKPGRIIRIPRPESDEESVALAPEPSNNHPLQKWKSEDERAMLVKVAKSFAGAPYRYGGDSVRGLDCSAFVKKIYELFEVELPRSAREQYGKGARIAHDELTTGDLVFFRTKRRVAYPTHVGIYIGENRFIHASSCCRQGVKINSLSEGYYARRFIGAVRVKVLPPDSAETGHNPSRGLVTS
jgi:peptidoglycan endopeptidase LytE